MEIQSKTGKTLKLRECSQRTVLGKPTMSKYTNTTIYCEGEVGTLFLLQFFIKIFKDDPVKGTYITH